MQSPTPCVHETITWLNEHRSMHNRDNLDCFIKWFLQTHHHCTVSGSLAVFYILPQVRDFSVNRFFDHNHTPNMGYVNKRILNQKHAK